jgi:hypothetical protein
LQNDAVLQMKLLTFLRATAIVIVIALFLGVIAFLSDKMFECMINLYVQLDAERG